jgi:hypothetical protein
VVESFEIASVGSKLTEITILQIEKVKNKLENYGSNIPLKLELVNLMEREFDTELCVFILRTSYCADHSKGFNQPVEVISAEQ